MNATTVTMEKVIATRAEIIGPGGFFELQDKNVDGHIYKVYRHAPGTSIEIIQSARGHGDAEWIVYEGRRYTYNQFFSEVDACAAALQQSGITAGDRVAIAMRNNPEWAIAFVAATLSGAVVVPVNSWGKTEELSYALTDSASKMLICDAPRWRLLDNVRNDLDIDIVVVPDDREHRSSDRLVPWDRFVETGRGQNFSVAEPDPLDLCLILYTSGSTGYPKGVAHRHIAVCQSVFNMMYLGMLVISLEGAREFKGGATVETPLLTVPLFHATGLLSGLHLPIMTGQKVVMMYRWDTLKALELIQTEKVTSLSSVPAIVQDLLANPAFDDFETGSLIRVTGAGAATPAGMPELIKQKCGNPSRSAGYGMTETLAVGGTMSGCIYDMKPEASGLVSPIMDMRMVDTTGAVLPAGEPGEIELSGITCTPGYWEKPEANEVTFVDERWIQSGDIGYVDDDGFLHITGRIKEIVIRGGENIYPGEIESAAFGMDEVHECVVFGEPDDAMGEELVMVIFITPGHSLQEQDLRDFLGKRIAGYKVPRTIRVAKTPLPRNASEKLHKLKVKEAYLAGAY
ncbi:acyl--CoA ligase [Halioglobus sp.]|nr:acyl--CoA ligase [Halioglobus sp.]